MAGEVPGAPAAEEAVDDQVEAFLRRSDALIAQVGDTVDSIPVLLAAVEVGQRPVGV